MYRRYNQINSVDFLENLKIRTSVSPINKRHLFIRFSLSWVNFWENFSQNFPQVGRLCRSKEKRLESRINKLLKWFVLDFTLGF